jgi:tetratricopeptide (TPR) repeat protein
MNVRVWFVVGTLLLSGFRLDALTQSNPEFEKGKELFEAGDYEQARKVFSDLAKSQPGNAEVYYYLGRTNARLNDLGKAVKWLKKAVALRDTSALYHLTYGNALFRLAGSGSKFKALGRAKRARKECERVLELDPDNIPARYSLMQFYLRAPGIAGGDKKKAESLAEEMVKLKPNRILPQLAKAEVLIATKKLDAARKQIEESVAFIRTRYDSLRVGRMYNLLGYRFLSVKRCDDAVSSFESYVSLAPNEPNAHDSLGEAYYKCGDLDASIAEYEKALALDPESENSRKMLKKVRKAKRGL